MHSAAELTNALKTHAQKLGFVLAGACPAVEPTGISRFAEWLERGFAGEMDYLARRKEAYEHPAGVLPGAKSLLMLAFPYRTQEPRECLPGQGKISRYAWGTADYHDLIHDRLKKLADELRQWVPDAKVRGVVDSAPLLEREFAQAAGFGWQGKHTLLIHRDIGSYFFLAALLTDQELIYEDAFAADHCGTCRACLDACPTKAFPEPYVLDATKCISYLTIELRQPIPTELRPGLEEWLFGCDVCQDVCPWNERPLAKRLKAGSDELEPADDANPIDLLSFFSLDDDAFRARFRHTPLWRSKRRGILRNAALVLGNQRCREAIPALIRGLKDTEPLIRGACAWALGQILESADVSAWEDLKARQQVEEDPHVRAELAAILAGRPDQT